MVLKIQIEMWSYYGSKTNLVSHYPTPKHHKIIEPFAGAARYSLEHFENDILLVDKYDVIVNIWNWLKQCSPNDILTLPRFEHGERYSDYNFDCIEQRNFVSFIHGCGDATPRNKPTKRLTVTRPNHVNFSYSRVANNLFKIKHWNIIHADYESIENTKATWFIDTPYQFGGEAYFHSNKKLDYDKLGPWCKSRMGQIIVCENTKATWLDFKPMLQQRGSLKRTTEAIWTNEKSAFDYEQQKLF